jgi:hypothetical protein
MMPLLIMDDRLQSLQQHIVAAMLHMGTHLMLVT